METANKTEEYPEVRVLTRKDRKKLSELIKVFVGRSGSKELTKMIPGQKGDADEKEEGTEDTSEKIYELVKSVMDGIMTWAEEEVAEWFMDLVGVNDREAYDKLPFDIEVHIIDSLLTQKGFNNFFMRASALFKKVRGLIK